MAKTLKEFEDLPIDEMIKVFKRHVESEYGQKLKELREAVFDFFPVYENEFGIKTNSFDSLLQSKSWGIYNEKSFVKDIRTLLTEYDVLTTEQTADGEDDIKIIKLVNELEKISDTYETK